MKIVSPAKASALAAAYASATLPNARPLIPAEAAYSRVDSAVRPRRTDGDAK